ncbi:LamG-like jellyroll fold domain-containing protein [Winogradskyella sp. Asnod2-B02-A]|uniref:LamG-like jellyroll fold domain-containing protein n=1 Tax=Winogradskyella sp. Asnod2-B02-A TaxID=3160583 RepID=UPI00386D3D64
MKKQILLSLSLIVSTIYLTLNAQNWNEIINATASDAGTGDYFGYSVAIDGDYAIVGANLNDDAGGSSGSAYIFVRSGNNWTAQTKLTASDAAAGDQFGTTVAIDGDYAIVGAYANSDAGGSSGSAYIFERSGNSWTEQEILMASDAAAGDQFGSSVSIDGDYAIVGANDNDDAGGSSGSTYIFVRLGGSWTEQAKLTASDATAGDRFGYSVAIDGDYAIVGAYGNDDAGNNSGSAYIFVRSGSTWTEQEELIAFDTAGGDQFGSSVSIAGDYAIVGAFGNDDAGSSSGSAYIFVRSGSSWTEQVKLTASDAAAIDIFGNSVSIAGDYAIVGAFGNDDAGNSSGSAYIFVRSGNSWAEEEKLTASDAAASDQFGYSVAIHGDYVIVGANGNDDNGNSSGSAYFFEKEPPAIVPDQTNLPDVTSQCEATPTAPAANSGTITATADVVFPITTQGTTIVTWTYNDGVGNTLTQLQNIIIDDTTAPILSFSNPSDALIDSCATEVIVPSPVIVENCTINTTLDFDGTNDRVTIPYSASLAFTTEFSVQAWIYPRANQYSRILTQYSASGNNSGEFVFDTYDGSNPTYLANGRGLRLVFTGTDGGAVISSNVLNLNSWNHVAGTFNNGVLKLYVNGIEVNSGNTTFTSIPTSTINLAIGEDINVGAYEFFNGQIDELSIWNKALKPSEITSGYNKILEGTESGLAAYYDFEEGTGSSVLIDKSSNGNDGLLTNMDSNTDWVTSAAPITMSSLTNDITSTSDASGTYPEGETTITWTATDANGNVSTLQQTINAGDTEAPSITFSNPTDASITSCDTNVTISSPLVSDNCAENTALDFDGVDDYVSISNFPFLTDLTLEAWIKPIYIANEGYRSIVSKGAVFDANTNFDFGIRRNWQNGNYTLYFYVQNGTTISGYALEINDTPNSWTHVAASFDNATKMVKLFQDGSLLGSSVLLVSPTNGGQNLRIAHPASTDGQDEPFTGQIDEVRIWNRVLSETEISNSNYNILSGSEPGLVAYYDFEEGTGSSVLIDKSSNGNDGVLTNMDSNTDWVTSVAPITMVSLTNDITGTSDASSTYPDGETTITWTATDANGNTSTLQQTINAGDTEAPSITFSDPTDANITSCDTNVTITSPLVSDNCSVNTALDFDGVNDYINLGSPLLSPSNGSQAHTVEMWVKTTPKSAYTILFNQYGWNELYAYRSVFYIDTAANGGNLVFFKGSYVNIEGTTNLLDNQWHHVAMVREISGELSLYVDGVVEAVGLDTYPYSNTNSLIGGQALLSDNYYSGVMDEVRIWNTARTQTQITNSFNANISDSESGLVAYYKFDDGIGSSVVNDESSNSYDGALINMDINTVWVPSTSPVASVTLTNDFNGTSDASGTYPEGETIVTWTATDTNGNQSTLEQIVNIVCSITYTFNNDVWSPNNPSGLATALDDIIVTSGNAAINSNTSANTVTVEAGASLTLDAALTATDITLNSTSTSYSSLLIGASGNVSGTINYNRFVNSNSLGNDLISSPLSGETWSDFLSPENATTLLDNGGTPAIYAFAPFDKTTGDYENYDVNTTAILSSGSGYRVATDTGETLMFSGTMPTDVSVNIMNTPATFAQWNLVGNPYPSYINVHAFLNHEVDAGISNLDLFTNASAAIYGYNANTENKWTIYNLANTTVSTVIAPGQGFFVTADATYESVYNLEFTTAMQTIGTSDDFIAGRNAVLELMYLTIDLSSNTNTYSTDVYFNANASEGLDKGYDADLWGSVVPEFSIYSHLVQDNTGKPVALQALNTTNLSDVSISLGVHTNQGEQITFSISETTLPATVNVFLDDVLTNTSTLLNNSDYTITPSTDLSGTGRFFLRTTEEALSVADNNFDAINIFYEKRTKDVLINGRIQNNTVVEVYDMQGRKVLSKSLDAAVLENRIHVTSLNDGVYVVNLKNSSKQKTQKIIIN